jgi:addiction module HigA family antidote
MLGFAVHPGEILAEELEALELSASEFARQIGVPTNRVSQIIAGKRSLSADTALRLSHWFGTSAEMWMGLQSASRAVSTKSESL